MQNNLTSYGNDQMNPRLQQLGVPCGRQDNATSLFLSAMRKSVANIAKMPSHGGKNRRAETRYIVYIINELGKLEPSIECYWLGERLRIGTDF